MPRSIRFHLDEHVNPSIAEGLRRRGIDVTTTADADLLGADDTSHVSFSLAQGRVIFTNDSGFLRLHAQGLEHPGIVYCQQRSRSVGQIIGSLQLIWEVLEPREMNNRVEFV
jgi:predicted nuclease of predicted toxin-antitoxin system